MWTTVSIFLYLLPLAAFWLVRFGARRSPLAGALDVALAVAGDMLLILLIARLVVLDVAVFVSRFVELGVLGWLLWRRRRTIWAAISWRHIAVAPLLAALVALGLSLILSAPYAIWDRQWHIPLTASLRGQLTPFSNVYEPGPRLFYHYAGNAHAAVFQSLSFAHMHASAALSRSHDVLFALTGLLVGLVLRALGVRGAALTLFVVVCMLAGGPATVLLEGMQRWGTGRSTVNLLSLSFRPHDPLAYLCATSFLVAAFAPLLSPDWPPRRCVPALMLSAAVLALSDELTLGILVGTLGVAWLLAPRAVLGTVWQRAATVVSPVVAILLTMLLLGGTFSPGAPRQSIELTPWRLPGFYIPSLPLNKAAGWIELCADYFSPLGVLLAALISSAARRDSRTWAMFVAHLAFVVASLGLLVFVRINHGDLESHRAVTGIGLLSPLLLAFWFLRLPLGEPRAWVLGLGGIACLFGVASTIEWLRGAAPIDAPRLRGYWGDDTSFYSTDCVAKTGARLGERALPSVGPTQEWYLFAGCRPVFSPPSSAASEHVIAVGWPKTDSGSFRALAAWSPAFSSLRVFYPRAQSELSMGRDLARFSKQCKPAGSVFNECVYSAEAYRAIVGSNAKGRP